MTKLRAKTPLRLDDRESRGRLLPALQALDAFAIRIERLRLGDCIVDDALFFERKTVLDLAASIVDGRLFGQALRLSALRRPAALIVEGAASDLARTALRREAVQGAMVNLALMLGLPVLRSRDADETAQIILYAAHQWRRAANGALPRHGRRPTGKRALQCHLLQGLPGIGPTRAARLLDRFGSVSAALAADADALSEVSGIGPGVAARIRWAVEEPLAHYTVQPVARISPQRSPVESAAAATARPASSQALFPDALRFSGLDRWLVCSAPRQSD